jgi:hypothetical protein
MYRYIKIPDPVTLIDPETNKVIKKPDGSDQVVTFKDILLSIMHNPKWNESFLNMKAAQQIIVSFDKATDGVMCLTKEEWDKLEEATQNPKQVVISTVFGSQVRPGFGFHPILSPQLIPLIERILEAEVK